MANNDDIIKRTLDRARPDAAMMLEAIKKANATIQSLSNDLVAARSAWDELFVTLGCVLNKYGREIVINADEKLVMDPQVYGITVEGDDDGRVFVRLKSKGEVTDAGTYTGKDNQPD